MIRHPFAAVATATLSATGAQAITIDSTFTIIDGVTTIATGNRTINLTVGSDLIAGSIVFIKSKTTGTETTIFGTGCTAKTITGVAGKTFCKTLIYDGTTFKSAGLEEQID